MKSGFSSVRRINRFVKRSGHRNVEYYEPFYSLNGVIFDNGKQTLRQLSSIGERRKKTRLKANKCDKEIITRQSLLSSNRVVTFHRVKNYQMQNITAAQTGTTWQDIYTSKGERVSHPRTSCEQSTSRGIYVCIYTRLDDRWSCLSSLESQDFDEDRERSST